MKSSDIKTEQDINKHIGDLELKKIADASRHARRSFINRLVTLGALFIIVLLGTIYPSIRESSALYASTMLQNIANWYVLLLLLLVAAIHRVVRYRIG